MCYIKQSSPLLKAQSWHVNCSELDINPDGWWKNSHATFVWWTWSLGTVVLEDQESDIMIVFKKKKSLQNRHMNPSILLPFYPWATCCKPQTVGTSVRNGTSNFEQNRCYKINQAHLQRKAPESADEMAFKCQICFSHVPLLLALQPTPMQDPYHQLSSSDLTWHPWMDGWMDENFPKHGLGRKQGQLAKRCACMHGGSQRKPRSRTIVSDEMKATAIDHVVNHSLSTSEAVLRVHPNLPLTNWTTFSSTLVKYWKQSLQKP